VYQTTEQLFFISIWELKLRMACACRKRLDETEWSETQDETPIPFGQRPRRDQRRTAPRLSTLSETRPRQDIISTSLRQSRDRDHIPQSINQSINQSIINNIITKLLTCTNLEWATNISASERHRHNTDSLHLFQNIQNIQITDKIRAYIQLTYVDKDRGNTTVRSRYRKLWRVLWVRWE